MTSRPSLVDELAAASGGRTRWAAAGRALVVFSAGGPALAARLRPGGVRSVGAMIATEGAPSVTLDSFPSVGSRAVLSGGEARIVDSATGRLLASRAAPADQADLAQRRRWDDIDVLRAVGAMIWTATVLPFALADAAVEVEEIEPLRRPPGEPDWRRLAVDFPVEWPVDAHHQVVAVDDRLRVREVESKPAWLGRKAPVRHMAGGHCDFDGFVVPTRRRIYRSAGATAPWAGRGPALLWVDVITAMVGRPPGTARGGYPGGPPG